MPDTELAVPAEPELLQVRVAQQSENAQFPDVQVREVREDPLKKLSEPQLNWVLVVGLSEPAGGRGGFGRFNSNSIFVL